MSVSVHGFTSFKSMMYLNIRPLFEYTGATYPRGILGEHENSV